LKFDKALIKKIDAVLPQTQCGQCGFDGCEPYATAIVEGRADINQCPPGDANGVQKIAALLKIDPKPLNTSHGLPKPRAVAVVDESLCIGCTFCIQSCPVDAIVGAAKLMHTVIADECTGCELCVTPCPIDCISMVPVGEQAEYATEEFARRADRARMRYQFRQQRIERKKISVKEKTMPETPVIPDNPVLSDKERKHAIVQAALKRAAAMRAQANK